MKCVDIRALWSAWADGELSAELGGKVASHIDGCEECRVLDLRMRALDNALEELGEESVEPPPFLATRIMARLEEGRTTVGQRLLAIFAPRRLAAYALVAAAFASGMLTMQTVSQKAVAPESLVASKVVLEFDSPSSEKVGLVGDFNEWGKRQVPMSAVNREGKWIFEIDLPPGRYQYAFEVDGKKWLPDPNAKGIIPDGFGGINSVLYISSEAGQKTM